MPPKRFLAHALEMNRLNAINLHPLIEYGELKGVALPVCPVLKEKHLHLRRFGVANRQDVHILHLPHPVRPLPTPFLGLILSLLQIIGAPGMTALRLLGIPADFRLGDRHAFGGTALTVVVYGARHDKATKRSLSLV